MEDEDKTKTQLLQKMVELQRRNAAELALVNKLNDAVNHGQSLKQIIRLLSKEVKKSFACKGVTILLLDANKSHLILQNSTFTPALIKRLEKLLGIDIPSVGLPLNKSGYYAEILQTAQPRLVTAAETIQSIINEFIQEAAFENERIRKRVHSKVPQIYHLLGIKSGISMPLISSEGAIGILDVFTNNIFDESDVEWVRRIAAQFLSIIKRKQLENDLKKDEKLLKETQKISKVGGWEIDVVSGKWKVTDTIYHIYQIPVGQKMSPEERMQFYPDYVRPKIRKAFDKLLQEGKPYDLELPFVTAKGKKRWIRTTAKAEKKAGKVVRVVGNLMDITESRRARDAAIENEKRYHLLFENSPAPLWEENFTGLFHYFAHLKKSGLEDL
ncbi:MAG: PAS domain-containing protein, partial [Actinobacteria bacterium]|nr:PAS domain-containing protein [Actinomycetota bacterium]